MPGADANPYLAFAAMLAAGLAGIEEELDCGAEYKGNAYLDPQLARLPSSLRDATDLFEKSALAKAAFGPEVVEFYAHHARLEHQAFSDAVTDWEKQQYQSGFESAAKCCKVLRGLLPAVLAIC